jgi:hypothetical protein
MQGCAVLRRILTHRPERPVPLGVSLAAAQSGAHSSNTGRSTLT